MLCIFLFYLGKLYWNVIQNQKKYSHARVRATVRAFRMFRSSHAGETAGRRSTNGAGPRLERLLSGPDRMIARSD